MNDAEQQLDKMAIAVIDGILDRSLKPIKPAKRIAYIISPKPVLPEGITWPEYEAMVVELKKDPAYKVFEVDVGLRPVRKAQEYVEKVAAELRKRGEIE